MEFKRQVVFYRHYFKDFFEPLNDKLKDKIDQVLFMVRVADRIPLRFFKRLSGTEGLYEIRIEFQSSIYRIFCCFDKGKIIVLFNGFQKKSQKTPKKEIEIALRLKDEYFKWKDQQS